MATEFAIARVINPTTSGDRFDIVVPGFGKPDAAIFFFNRATVPGTYNSSDHMQWSIGFTDGTNHRAVGGSSEQGQTTSDTWKSQRTDAVGVIPAGTDGTESTFEFVGWLPDGVRLESKYTSQTTVTVILIRGVTEAAVGTFTPNATVDTASSRTGKTTQPNLAFFIGIGHTAATTTGVADNMCSWGVAIDDGASTKQMASIVQNEDAIASATAKLKGGLYTNRCTGDYDATSGLIWAGEITAWASTGWTMTTRTGGSGSDLVFYLDMTVDCDLDLVKWDTPSTTTTPQTKKTSLGCEPRFLITAGGHLSTTAGNTETLLQTGVADKYSSQEFSLGCGDLVTGTTDPYHVVDSIIHHGSEYSSGWQALDKAEIDSWDADGVTYNYTTIQDTTVRSGWMLALESTRFVQRSSKYTLQADADGTLSNLVHDAGSSGDYYTHLDDLPDGNSSDWVANNQLEQNGNGLFSLSNFPNDLPYRPDEVFLEIDLDSTSFSDDTCTLSARLYQGNATTTPLSDSLTVATDSDVSTRTQLLIPFENIHNVDGWYDATEANTLHIQLDWNYTKSGGGDNGQIRVYGFRLRGKYAVEAIDSRQYASSGSAFHDVGDKEWAASGVQRNELIPARTIPLWATKNSAEGTGTSITVTKPDGTVEGDLLVAALTCDTTVSSAPSGWTLQQSQAHGTATAYLYTKMAGASEGASYVWNLTASAAYSAVIGRVINVDSTDGYHASAKTTAGSGASSDQPNSGNAPALTTTVDDCLIVQVVAMEGQTTELDGPPPKEYFTEHEGTASGTSADVTVASTGQAFAGPVGTPTWYADNPNSTQDWALFTLAIKPQQAASGATDLTINDLASVPTIDNLVLTSTTDLTIAELASVPTIDNLDLTSSTDLTVAELASVPTIDNIDFTLGYTLSVDELASVPTIDNLDLTSTTDLTIAELASVPTIDNLDLTSTTDLTIAELASATTIDNIDLTVSVPLEINDATSPSTVDGLVLTTASYLAIDDAASVPTIDNLDLTSTTDLVIGDANSPSTIDNLDLTVNEGTDLDIADLASVPTTDNLDLTLASYLAVNDLASVPTIDNLDLTSTTDLVIGDLASVPTMDNLELTVDEGVTLSVNDVASVPLTDNLALTLDSTLAVADIASVPLLDLLTLTVTTDLVINDANVVPAMDNLTLNVGVVLTINELTGATTVDAQTLSVSSVLQIDDLAVVPLADNVTLTLADVTLIIDDVAIVPLLDQLTLVLPEDTLEVDHLWGPSARGRLWKPVKYGRLWGPRS